MMSRAVKCQMMVYIK